MVQNAKDFNDKRSLIFEDAERVRKGASNWFVRHNPAYNDRNYVAKPTPLPGEANGTPSTPAPISLKITNKAAPVRTPAASATPVPAKDEEEDAEGEEDAVGLSDFKGKSFQKAQEQLIEELINYVEYASTIHRDVDMTDIKQARKRSTDLHAIPLSATALIRRLLRPHQAPGLAERRPKTDRRQARSSTGNRSIHLQVLGSARTRAHVRVGQLPQVQRGWQ
jgi:hypothetical protein